MRILGYIPARLGSARVKAKNLRLLGGRPLIGYAVETARSVRQVEQFFVNTESAEIAAVAEQLGSAVYRRSPVLASSTASTDDIVVDFLKARSCDAVVVVNPTVPFLKPETIDMAVDQFLAARPTSLFSVSRLRKHALLNGRPVNFAQSAPSPRTQDLEPIAYLNFAICIFDAAHALATFEAQGYFIYTGNLHYFEISELEAVDIDSELDFQIAEAILGAGSGAHYHPLIGDASQVAVT